MHIFKVVISREFKIKSRAIYAVSVVWFWFGANSHGRLMAADGVCNVRSGLRVSPTEAVVELGIGRGALMCVLWKWWGAYGWGHHAWVEGMLGSLIKSRVLSFLAHGSKVIITWFLFLLSSPTAETQRYTRMSLILSPLTITHLWKWQHNSAIACFVTSLCCVDKDFSLCLCMLPYKYFLLSYYVLLARYLGVMEIRNNSNASQRPKMLI